MEQKELQLRNENDSIKQKEIMETSKNGATQNEYHVIILKFGLNVIDHQISVVDHHFFLILIITKKKQKKIW
jgi:hypothetical protein